ncbi:MAG: tetratricopeptide repeat protein [Chitinispirillaceae bacterium]|nr:tetratricopeptide repeat protein [Chitinispirillaceae bacterium]
MVLSRSVSIPLVLVILILTAAAPEIAADATFDKLLSEKKYQEAIDFADQKLSTTDRDALTWIKIGEANNALGMPEKALACFLVSWRMNPNDYNALLGAARAYNVMKQSENAMEMAQKALAIKFTAEASWEYAQACIAIGRPSEAKKAMEKVLESDSSNVIAARELANIYFSEGAWSSAVPLLKRGFSKNASGELAFQIGKAYAELGVGDSALSYLKKAVQKNGPVIPSRMMLARAWFTKKNYAECAKEYRGVPADSMKGRDWYEYGIALEKTQGIITATEYYQKAVDGFGRSSTTPEALLAREKLSRAYLQKRAFNDAIGHFKVIIAADPKGKTVSDGYFLLAEAYMGIKDTKSAISSLEKAINVNSRNVEAYARLADLYQSTGDSEKAKKTFEVLMGLSPDDPKIYLALGKYNLKSRRYDEALRQFEKSSKLKNSAAAHEGYAQAAFELKKYDLARDAAQAALTIDKQARDARMVLALVHMNNGNFSGAKDQFESLLKSDPDNATLLEHLANCYGELKLTDKLVTIDRKIAAMNNANTASRMRLARYYAANGNTAEALRYYRELYFLLPKDTAVLRPLSFLAKKNGLTVEAVKYTQQYLTVNPNDAEAHRDLGDLYYEQKNLDGALAEYRTALKLDPSITGFHKRYAEIVMAKGQQEEVIKALAGVIKSGSADVSTYMTLGLIYQKKKKYIDAVEAYQKALQLEPSNFDALVALGSCQAVTGDISNAIVSYEQAVMMNTQAVDEFKELGDLYAKEQRDDEAFKKYREYLDKKPEDEALAEKVGSYLFVQGDTADAFKYFQIAKKQLSPENTVRYATVCLNMDKSGEALGVLLPLKANKKVGTGTALQRTVHLMVAQAFEKDKDTLAAARTYGEYFALKGVNDPDAAFRQALLLEKKDPIQARKIYEQNCKRYPADYRNFLHLGLLYSEQKLLLSQAIPLFKRVTELADSIPSVWLELGKIYAKTGDEDEELRAYQRYVETDPQNVDANQRIGTILIRKERYNEGIVFLEIANTLQQDDPEVTAALAKGYMKTNRSEEAISLLNKAKSKMKDVPEIRFQLFELYQKTGQKDKAKEEIEALVGMKREPRYLQLYAEALMIQKKYDEAEKTIEEILATAPDNIPTLMLKGRVLRKQKRYDEAVEVYKEISYIQPDHAPSLSERADTHMEQSKPQWAETFYKRSLRADPNYGRAELGLAKLCKLKKDTAGYREHLENARRLQPDDEEIQEELKKASR